MDKNARFFLIRPPPFGDERPSLCPAQTILLLYHAEKICQHQKITVDDGGFAWLLGFCICLSIMIITAHCDFLFIVADCALSFQFLRHVYVFRSVSDCYLVVVCRVGSAMNKRLITMVVYYDGVFVDKV